VLGWFNSLCAWCPIYMHRGSTAKRSGETSQHVSIESVFRCGFKRVCVEHGWWLYLLRCKWEPGLLLENS